MERKDEKKSANATPAAVAAALAMLGLSVGVDVPELFAESPPDQIESKQEKISPTIQGKEKKQIKIPRGRQGKVESLQDKTLSRQNKAQGTLQHKIEPIDQGELPAVQNKVKGSLQQKVDATQSKIEIETIQKKASGIAK